MSPEEWNHSNDVFHMLWYLRGDVSEEDRVPPSTHSAGRSLYSGVSKYVSIAQCQRFVKLCLKRWNENTGRACNEYQGSSLRSIDEVLDLHDAALLHLR